MMSLIRCNFNNVYTSTQSFFEFRNGQLINSVLIFIKLITRRKKEPFIFILVVLSTVLYLQNSSLIFLTKSTKRVSRDYFK